MAKTDAAADVSARIPHGFQVTRVFRQCPVRYMKVFILCLYQHRYNDMSYSERKPQERGCAAV